MNFRFGCFVSMSVLLIFSKPLFADEKQIDSGPSSLSIPYQKYCEQVEMLGGLKNSHHIKCDNICKIFDCKGRRGPRGLTGPTGPTGTTGATGATGATGSLSSAYASRYTDTFSDTGAIPRTFTTGSTIPLLFNTDGIIPFGITYSPVNNSFSFSQTGIYLIDYGVFLDTPPGQGPGFGPLYSIELTKGGTAVSGSMLSLTQPLIGTEEDPGTQEEISGQILVSIATPAADTIALTVPSTATGSIYFVDAGNGVQAYIKIVRVADLPPG